MKKFLKNKILLTGASLVFAVGIVVLLFYDAFYSGKYRCMQDKIAAQHQVDLTGLRELQASGGSSVLFSDLQRKLKNVKGPKIIVDGMAEFHGYIKGIPTTFFAYQRDGNPDLKHLIRRLVITGTTDIRPDLVTSEISEAKKYGFEYKKVNIGSRFIETNENIDEIVDFYDHVPHNTWLHFHCKHGRGRTSLLIVMLDIMRNAPKVALKDIIKRQHLLGSEDLFNTTVWKHGTYDRRKLLARKQFIEHFYEFICQRKAGGIQRWSEWNRKNKVG